MMEIILNAELQNTLLHALTLAADIAFYDLRRELLAADPNVCDGCKETLAPCSGNRSIGEGGGLFGHIADNVEGNACTLLLTVGAGLTALGWAYRIAIFNPIVRET